MNPQKAGKLLQDLKQEVSLLEQQAENAERRRAIAEKTASSLEDRNERAIKAVEQAVENRRQEIISEAEAQASQIKVDITGLSKTKKRTQDEIVQLNETQAKLTNQVEATREEKRLLDDSLQTAQYQLEYINEALAKKQQQTEDLRREKQTLDNQIKQLVSQRQLINNDLAVLENEATKLEERIIDLDAVFKARKEDYDKQLGEAKKLLDSALSSLQQAQKQDKQVREAWAEEHLKLDKRTKAVQKMEARLAGAEERVRELDNYLKL